MQNSELYLNPSKAAQQLGVSTKALRIYEDHGLIAPTRTAAGWRTYGPEAINRAARIVALRALGMSLAEIGRVLAGDIKTLERALTTQQRALEGQIDRLGATLATIAEMRAAATSGKEPSAADLADLRKQSEPVHIQFDLPWPWGGEPFDMGPVGPLTFITGPLGSGKTRLARAIAAVLPNGRFVGLDRADASTDLRASETLRQLLEDGARDSQALRALVSILETVDDAILVFDLIEQDLERRTQAALAGYLRRRAANGPPVFAMTRSTVLLDLDQAGPADRILFCPANHSPPMLVYPYAGAAGYEAVASCLAPPEVRARTEGVIAIRPGAG